MKKLILIVSVLLLAILFTGCVTVLSSDTVVKLDEKEKWELNQEILFEGESFTEYGQAVVDGLNTMAIAGETSGLDITFKQLPDRQGNVPYSVSIKGKGLDQLNEMLGSTAAGLPAFSKQTVNGKSVYGFEMDATSLSSGGLDLGFSPTLNFTIEGMKVLDTNGKKSANSVTWENPMETMTATLSPSKSDGAKFAWWIIPVVIVGLAIVAFVILLIAGVFKKKQPQSQYYYPTGYGTGNVPPPIPSSGVAGVPPMLPAVPGMAVPPYPVVPQAPIPPPPPASLETTIASSVKQDVLTPPVPPKPQAKPRAKTKK